MFGLCSTTTGTFGGSYTDAAPVELALHSAGWQNVDQ